MEAVVDIARDFKVFIPSPAEVISFDMPSTIVFNRGEDNNVEVKISDGQAADYDLRLSQRNLSGFSPHENMKESFEQVFNYYLYHSVTQRVTDLQKINIIIPLFSSVAFENLLLKVNEGKGVYRDVEVYSAYYLNESLDLPELNHFAEEDNGAHIYGIVSSRDYPYLYLVNYDRNGPPGIIDFMGTHSTDDLFNIFKLMIKNQSFAKSQVFFFTEGEVKGLSEVFAEGRQHKAIEIEFEKGKHIPLRLLRKKDPADNPLVNGIRHLVKNPLMAPVFRLSLFSQESQTGFAKIRPGSDLSIVVDFKRVPKEFFINFYAGANPYNLFLLERLFVDLGAIVKVHLEFKGKVERLEEAVKITLLHQDKIKQEALFPLRKEYQIT
jgi:hypothetical protein